MALRFLESFDHYSSDADKLTKWTANVNATGNVAAGIGRFGTKGWTDSLNTRQMYKQLDSQATWIVGAAIQSDIVTATNTPLIGFYDALTPQCYLRIGTLGKLEFIRQTSNIIGTGTIVLSANVYYYIEVKVTISDASGVVVVKINGVTDINVSSVDTKNTANATADAVFLNGGATPGGSGATVHYDDLYVLDGTGGSPYDDFLGDLRVEALMPNGNGNSSVLVGSDGNSTDNYLLVDEVPANGDTDYVESSTVGDKDTYNYGALTPTTGTVHGIQILPYAKKTDAGVRSIKSVARHSGTEEDSADFTLASTYQYFEDLRTTKPGGGSWSISDINAAEFGVKISA